MYIISSQYKHYELIHVMVKEYDFIPLCKEYELFHVTVKEYGLFQGTVKAWMWQPPSRQSVGVTKQDMRLMDLKADENDLVPEMMGNVLDLDVDRFDTKFQSGGEINTKLL